MWSRSGGSKWRVRIVSIVAATLSLCLSLAAARAHVRDPAETEAADARVRSHPQDAEVWVARAQHAKIHDMLRAQLREQAVADGLRDSGERRQRESELYRQQMEQQQQQRGLFSRWFSDADVVEINVRTRLL